MPPLHPQQPQHWFPAQLFPLVHAEELVLGFRSTLVGQTAPLVAQLG